MTEIDETFRLFNDETCRWEIPMEKYVKEYKKLVKGK
jgi:hypothetical protein